jgi:hypothetical protein
MDWLVEVGSKVRPAPPVEGLYDRLKFFAGLVADSPADQTGGPRLLWRNDRREVLVFAVMSRVVVGRDAGCDVRFASPCVSRRHCELTVLRGVVWLSDLGSVHGTFLNGRRVTVPAPLRDGDLVELGGEVLAFVRCPLQWQRTRVVPA